MSEPKRVLHPVPGAALESTPRAASDAPDRSANVIAFGLVAVVSMLFGFCIGLFF